MRVDADLSEEGLHAERARLVWNDRHNPSAELFITKQFGKQANEHHRCGCLPALGAFVEFVEEIRRHALDPLSRRIARRHPAAELLTTLSNILRLRTAIRRLVEWRFGD